jgi:hypothetical protein
MLPSQRDTFGRQLQRLQTLTWIGHLQQNLLYDKKKGDATSLEPPMRSASQARRAPGLFASVMLELVDNNGADDDAPFDDLLPVSGNVGEVENVI